MSFLAGVCIRFFLRHKDVVGFGGRRDTDRAVQTLNPCTLNRSSFDEGFLIVL